MGYELLDDFKAREQVGGVVMVAMGITTVMEKHSNEMAAAKHLHLLAKQMDLRMETEQAKIQTRQN